MMRQWRQMTGAKKTLTGLLALIATMTALVWASPTLYDYFCRVTGFGGTPLRADANDNAIGTETIRVRFDASLNRGMPWDFEPVERIMEVRVGETNLAFYEAFNPTARPVAGSASYNIAPYAAQGFFTKIDCFCFEEQLLQPGERVQMPVSFFVDPAIVDDREGQYVHTITLSYTFHEIDLPEETALVLPTGAAGLTSGIGSGSQTN